MYAPTGETVNQASDRAAARGLALERERATIMKLWLQGYSISDIQTATGVDAATSVIQAIRLKRRELQEVQEAEILELAAERIEGLRQLQRESRTYMAILPDKAAQFLTVILRAEETMAKIQGVLSDKVIHLGRVEHHVKLYDFQDSYPMVEGEITKVTLSEPEPPNLPPALASTTESRATEVHYVDRGPGKSPIKVQVG